MRKVLVLTFLMAVVNISCSKEFTCECIGKKEIQFFEINNGLPQDTLLEIVDVYNVNFEEIIKASKKSDAEYNCTSLEDNLEGYSGTVGGNDSVMFFSSSNLTCNLK